MSTSDYRHRRRTFALWQPAYAEHGIATFPVRSDKVPAIRGYHKVGLRGSGQLAAKFADMPALGFMCGPRSRVTVLDVDASDERVLAKALDRHGPTPIIVRTASGNRHAWYRHAGERRKIRPWPGLAIDILGSGFVVAPPSKTVRGQYQFIDGSLDDLGRLPVMQRLDAPGDLPVVIVSGEDVASPLRGLREHDGRNNALFRAIAPAANEIHDAAGTRDALFDVAVSHNRECAEPMSVQEVSKVVDSVWRMTCEGRNWVGQRDRRERELSTFSDDPDAFFLLELLRVNEGASATFWIANGLADKLGWTMRRFVNARNRLVELGYVKQIRRPWQGKPALYVWP